MKLRGDIIHGILLILALGAAYFSWSDQEAEPVKDKEVKIWRLEDISEVHYAAEGRMVSLTPRGEGKNAQFWGRTERAKAVAAKKPPPAPADPHAGHTHHGSTPEKVDEKPADKVAPAAAKAADAKAADAKAADAKPVEAPAPEISEFLLNARGQEAYEAFHEPLARRGLGVLADDRLEALALKEPEATVKIKADGGVHDLQVGMMAFGGGLRYVRTPATGQVYVVPAKLIDDLKWSDTRLVERNLHSFGVEDLKGFSVQVGERSRRFERSGEGKKIAWRVASEEGDAVSESAQAWLGKLFRFRADRYLREGEPRHSDSATPEVEVMAAQFETQKGDVGSLKLTRFGEGREGRWYARTERIGTRVLVSRYMAEEVQKDLDSLLQ